MRKEFADFLWKEMVKNTKIYLITADLGFGVLDAIRRDFPERCINCGASEQLMVGLAVGLAYSGYIPLCYSITPFVLYRPFEMIRNYVNHERVPVKLVGCGRGRDYAKGGFTHWAEDDIDIVKVAFPNIRIYTPNKPDDSLFRDFVESPEACYINLSR